MLRPIAGTCLLLCLSNISVVSAEELFDALDGANQVFAQAVLDGDIDHLVGDYTTDACVIAPSTPKMCGLEEIRGFWSNVIASKPKHVKITTEAVGSSGELAFASGLLALTDVEGIEHLNRFVLVLKNVSGTWKLHIDTWTPL